MAKVIKKENIRVEVDLGRTYFGYQKTEKDQIRRAEDIISQIKRHVDDVSHCDVIWDIEETCEFCGSIWEVNEDANDPDWGLGEPVCCVEASDEWRQQKKT